MAIAFVVFVAPFTANFLLLGVIFYFLFRLISTANTNNEALLGAAYVMGFEVFARMTGGSFSYEFAKYAVAVFLIIGILYEGFKIRSFPYILFILILIPGIFVASVTLNVGAKVGNAIGFNLSGPICLAITAIYCYDRRITLQRMQEVLLAMLFPILSMTFYLYLFTPNLKDALSGTASNFAASGGFGPNQVATVLGLGMFILFTRLLVVKGTLINSIDLVLLGLVSYRGIATFSRGGIITAIICSVLFCFFYFRKVPIRELKTLVPRLIIVVGVLIAAYAVVSVFSGGLIDKRYTNKDAAGNLKTDITTGRTELISTELEAFFEQPFAGIGVGKVKEYRYEKTGESSATHNEVSRMLSEHGLLGIIGLLILIFTPLIFMYYNRTNYYLVPFLVFWFATINHSSMRIAAPAFIYGLCLITIIHEKKNTLRR